MASGALSPDLRAILSEVEILSGSRYRVKGHLRDLDEEERGADGDAVGAAAGDLRGFATRHPGDTARDRPTLAEALEDDLYARLYARWVAPSSSRRRDVVAHLEQLAAIDEANTGRGTWQPDWRISEVGTRGEHSVERYGVVFQVSEDHVRCEDGAGPEVGSSCRVRVPAGMRRLLAGFYLAVGEADQAPERDLPWLVRLYWNLRLETAAPLVAALTDGLNRREIPFRLKVATRSRWYPRADAGVLYLEPATYEAAREVFRQAHRAVRHGLLPEVPLFAARLAPGLGVAEGSADGASFGRHRCRLVARALTGVFEAGGGAEGDRAEAVRSAFRGEGLDPARPYLAPGSTSRYRPLPETAERPAGRRQSSSGGSPAPRSFEDAARGLGDSLCREAWWLDDRCNWLGHDRESGDPRKEGVKPVLAAMSAGLYRGTAGIGLFLAELYSITGDETHRRTASGAIRQALGALESDPDRYPPWAYYGGRLGVARSCGRVAARIEDGELAARAESVLSEIVGDLGGERPLDVIHGNAGAIPCLLDLYRETARDRFLDAAEALGKEILESADRRGDDWTWPNERVFNSSGESPPLTGLSHGAAGIGLALLELFSVTGRRRFREGALGAFAYEDGLFDSDQANWPVFRSEAAEHHRDSASRDYRTAWCHGAAGIALARLRAMVIDPERRTAYERAARDGLAATLAAIHDRLAEDGVDATLCHGLSGLIDIALTAACVLGEVEPRRAAENAMRHLVARYAESANWPSGTRSRARNPSLLLGEAGIGYTLLRLSDPWRYPSVLLPGAGCGGPGLPAGQAPDSPQRSV